MKALHYFSLYLLASLLAAPLEAAVSLPSIISDHAMLQKAPDTPVWGKANPGEQVTVTLGMVSAQTVANGDGKWRVNLDLGTANTGPFTLTVKGENTLTVSDVLVGEVWLCGGQSNMEFPLARAIGAKEEAAAANVPLRQFTVTRATPTAPEEDCAGAWLVASPTTAGKFSAVGWFFGKRIAAETGAPVGLIASYWGGTAVEPWISATAFDPDPELKARTGQMLRDITSLPQRTEDYARLYPAWTEKHGRQDNRVGSTADYTGPEVDTANWRKVRMPLRFTDAGLPDAGAVWLRRSIKLPVKPGNLAVQSSVIVDLGKAGQFDEVYWNGEKIGETSPTIANFANRAYTVPAKLPKDGVNVLAVRIHAPAGGGGLLDPQALFRVRLTDGVVELAGDWLAKVEYELPPLTATARAEYPPQPEKIALRDSPTLLFNGMINPLIPYGMRGVIWYQGESNVDRAQQYRSAFPLLIRDWRAQWGRGDFPFYFCQLANYRGIQKEPGNSPWAELREAQDRTLTVPNTGMAVLIDIGEEWDIHPRNKGDVGGRLALIALHHTYGKQNMEFSGPRFESVKFDGNRAAVKFTHANGGLVAKPLLAEYQPVSLQSKKMPLVRNTPDSEVEGFAICGEDRQWKWADAKIAGDTVIVSAAGVEKPVAVRYAWGNNPMCNLYNQAGLPAAPFRTDNFPGVTDGKKY